MKLIALNCIFLLVWLSACNDEPINFTCADPLGTDAITLKNNQFTCYQESFNNCILFRMEGNLPVLRSYIAVTDNEVASFVDVGEVQCLREVIEKPTSGWVFGILVEVHHGYVIKMEDGTYGRLFVHSWKKSGDQVTEVNITRQYAF